MLGNELFIGRIMHQAMSTAFKQVVELVCCQSAGVMEIQAA